MSSVDSQTDPLVIVTGTDENYSIGLAVTVRSMLFHLNPQRHVEMYLLDGGISPATKQRLLASWVDPRLRIHWLDANMDTLRHLVTAGHLNHTTYLRLLLPDILPAACRKAIYLDSDLLIRRDIGLLWDECLGGQAVLAGQETGAPYVDAKIVFAEQPSKYSKVGITTPIKNYRELGMNPWAKVFNAGLMLINVDYWRKHQIPQQAFECLKQHREHVLFCDQYALNVVLAGKWRELDTRWNQTAHFYNYRGVDDSPFEDEIYRRLKHDPWVCHFTWMYKPWWQGCDHPFAAEFVQQMRLTDWRNHQLEPNPGLAQQTKELNKQGVIPRRTWSQWLQKRKHKLAQHWERLVTSREQPDRRAA